MENTENTTICCIALVSMSGVKFPAKCWFEMERQKTEYYYFATSKGKKYECILGYPHERYEGKAKLQSRPGKWFVKRQCFETVNGEGKKDVWYDNEFNMIGRVSKYGKKQYEELQKQIN